MVNPVRDPEAWVATTVEILNDAGSWTGRMHVHKTLFIAQVLGLADPPFEFELYQYGPYSFDLDETIAVMDAFGYLTKSFPEPGYGPKYKVTELSDARRRALCDKERQAIKRVAQQVGEWDTRKLELVATCLWAERREGLAEPDNIVQRVRHLKPKYSPDAVNSGLAEARSLVKQLAA